MAHCIPTYMLASGLIKAGMSWWQALITILLGNSIVLVPILAELAPRHQVRHPLPRLRARRVRRLRRQHAGDHARHRRVRLVRHPVLDRRPRARTASSRRFWPRLAHAARRGRRSAATCPPSGSASSSFWGINILIVYRGMELLRRVENWAAPYVLVMTLAAARVDLRRASRGRATGSASIARRRRASSPRSAPSCRVFVPSVTAMVGFWATLSLNMPDFTRYGRSQREQAIGQVVALPTTMTLFAAMGVFITSASALVFGEAIWDPDRPRRQARVAVARRRSPSSPRSSRPSP